MKTLKQKTHWIASWPTALVLLATASAISLVTADAASAQAAGRPPQGPPAEALAACKSLASGAACSFTGRRGAVTGTCFTPQQGMALACRPKDASSPGGAASGPKP